MPASTFERLHRTHHFSLLFALLITTDPILTMRWMVEVLLTYIRRQKPLPRNRPRHRHDVGCIDACCHYLNLWGVDLELIVVVWYHVTDGLLWSYAFRLWA